MPKPSTHDGVSWRVRWAQRENERRRVGYMVRDERWQAELADLDRMLAAARTFEGAAGQPGSPLVPKRGERVHLALPDVTLVEGTGPPPRPLPAESAHP